MQMAARLLYLILASVSPRNHNYVTLHYVAVTVLHLALGQVLLSLSSYHKAATMCYAPGTALSFHVLHSTILQVMYEVGM